MRDGSDFSACVANCCTTSGETFCAWSAVTCDPPPSKAARPPPAPPSLLAQLGGAGGGLAALLGGGSQVTADQAQKVSPEVVQQLATHAEKSDPSLIDKASEFYSQHPALIKTLGGAALTIAMSKMAERRSA